MPYSQPLPRYLIRNKNDNFLQCLSRKSPLIIGMRNKKDIKFQTEKFFHGSLIIL